MKRLRFVLATVLLVFAVSAAPARAQQITAQSVTTQRLVLSPPAPIAVTALQASPSVQGVTSYWYWVVAHVGSEISAPQGPAVITNGPASLGGFAVNTISWDSVSGASSYDVLRTTSSTLPAGACNCAVIIGVAQFSATDSSNSLLSYTVSTSPDQVSAVCTNTNSCAGVITGVTVGAPNQQYIYLSPNCGLSPTLGNCFQIHDDVIMQTGCTWAASSSTVNCASGTFHSTAVDSGKDFGGYQTCQTNAGPGVTPGYRLDFPAGTVISSVNNSGQAIVSANSTNAETGTGCVMYGTPDDTGFAAAKAFWLTASQCFSVDLPSGIWALKDPHNFFGSASTDGEPPACFQSGASVGEGAGASYAITGTNPSTSIMWLPPDFISANCNSQSEYGNACFWNSNGLWRDFQVTTGGLPTFGSGFATQHAIFASAGQVNGVTNSNQFAFFENFYCVNVTPMDSKATGFSTGPWWTEHRFVYADGCGGVSIQNLNAAAPYRALDSKYEDNCCGAVVESGAGFQFVSMGGNQFWDGPLYSAGQPVLVGNISLQGDDQIFKNGAASAKCWGGNGIFVASGGFGNGTSGVQAINCNEPTGFQTGAIGDKIFLDGFSFGGTGTAVNVLQTGVSIFMSRSFFGGTAGIVGNANAPTLHDRGFNGFNTVSADVVVVCDVNSNSDQFCQETSGSITLVAGAGSHTFALAYAVAPVCTATDTTAANAVKVTSTTTAISVTGTGTDVIAWTCIPAQP